MTVVGLIPARGGSKGIPGKNIASCGGKPLIAWTCEAAKASQLQRVIASTDSDEIASVCQKWGVEVPFLRPSDLAGDQSLAVDVMLHALDFLEEEKKTAVSALMLLQPTSPLRTSQHIDEALQQYITGGADTLVSVTAVPHSFNPDSLCEVNDGWALPLQENFGSSFLRQSKPKLYARNGPAILIVSAQNLRKRKFYDGKIAAYLMGERDSLDIDTPAELAFADFLMRGK